MKRNAFYVALLLLFSATLQAGPRNSLQKQYVIKLDPTIVHFFLIDQNARALEESVRSLLEHTENSYPPSPSMNPSIIAYKAQLRQLSKDIARVRKSIRSMRNT